MINETLTRLMEALAQQEEEKRKIQYLLYLRRECVSIGDFVSVQRIDSLIGEAQTRISIIAYEALVNRPLL